MLVAEPHEPHEPHELQVSVYLPANGCVNLDVSAVCLEKAQTQMAQLAVGVAGVAGAVTGRPGRPAPHRRVRGHAGVESGCVRDILRDCLLPRRLLGREEVKRFRGRV